MGSVTVYGDGNSPILYWTSFVSDLRISENSVVGKKDIFQLFLTHINLCTEEVNVCLCEAVQWITLTHCWE